MCKLLAFLTLLVALVGCKTLGSADDAASDVKFFGDDSRRAALSFETTLYYTLPDDFSGDARAVYDSELKVDIDEQINLQLAHLFSAFVNHTKPYDFSGNPGIPRDRPAIKVLATEQVAGHRAVYVHYSYRDIAVFKKDLFHGSDSVTLRVLLPKAPKVIYDKGLVDFKTARKIYADDQEALDDFKALKAEGETKVNLCTDLHYNTEGDYWYFWNPYQRGCPQATKDATIEVKAHFKPMNSTTNTFPRYDTLYGDNGNGDEMRITFLVGIDETWKKGDLGRIGFEKTFRMLTEGQELLAAQTGDVDTDLLLPPEAAMLKANPDFRFQILKDQTRQKTLRFKQDGHNILLNMYLVSPESDDFVTLAKKGLKQSDIFIYDGHSGLGGFLSVGRVFGERQEPLPKDKYQIFFFNGCSTFSYYNYDYFQLKTTASDPNGFKNLDIVTSATPAAFSSGPGTDYWLIRSLASGERKNWQGIMKGMRQIAGEDTALLHVNGDEDNPKTPNE